MRRLERKPEKNTARFRPSGTPCSLQSQQIVIERYAHSRPGQWTRSTCQKIGTPPAVIWSTRKARRTTISLTQTRRSSLGQLSQLPRIENPTCARFPTRGAGGHKCDFFCESKSIDRRRVRRRVGDWRATNRRGRLVTCRNDHPEPGQLTRAAAGRRAPPPPKRRTVAFCGAPRMELERRPAPARRESSARRAHATRALMAPSWAIASGIQSHANERNGDEE